LKLDDTLELEAFVNVLMNFGFMLEPVAQLMSRFGFERVVVAGDPA
jgi:hypothetical protein